jgi:hypothetical protein
VDVEKVKIKLGNVIKLCKLVSGCSRMGKSKQSVKSLLYGEFNNISTQQCGFAVPTAVSAKHRKDERSSALKECGLPQPGISGLFVLEHLSVFQVWLSNKPLEAIAVAILLASQLTFHNNLHVTLTITTGSEGK